MALRVALLSAVIVMSAAWPPPNGCPSPWKVPNVDDEFNVSVSVPDGAVVTKTSRQGDTGAGADLHIRSGGADVYVWNDDGDAYFQVKHGESLCRIDVGSDGAAPGPYAQVFEERGMRCALLPAVAAPSPAKGHLFELVLHIEEVSDGSADCPRPPPNGCPPPWNVPNLDDEFNVSVSVPDGAVVTKTSMNGDTGYGADLHIRSGGADVYVWNDDGDAYFQVKHGESLCKIDVGSDGGAPGPYAQVFEERGMRCTLLPAVAALSPAKGHLFQLVLHIEEVSDGSADCQRPSDLTALMV